MTAPSLKSTSAVLSCPSAQAKCSAVFPWLFSKLMILTCWFSISASTQSVQPYLQDKFMRLTFSIHRHQNTWNKIEKWYKRSDQKVLLLWCKVLSHHFDKGTVIQSRCPYGNDFGKGRVDLENCAHQGIHHGAYLCYILATSLVVWNKHQSPKKVCLLNKY